MDETAKRPRRLRIFVIGTAVAVAAIIGGAGAQAGMAVVGEYASSPVPGGVQPAGLWDRPNEACMTQCKIHVEKGCFKRLAEKNPEADPASIQEKCDEKFSLCLYDCMCDTCDENQIIIRQ